MAARYKGLVILANLNTKERMVVFIDPHRNNIIELVNKKYGGDWVMVNEFCLGDVLRFDCQETYFGFNPSKEDDNYCQGSLEIKAF
ncbi:MAG: hypothetical protein ACOVOV_02555 [Dolichospermum sp.]